MGSRSHQRSRRHRVLHTRQHTLEMWGNRGWVCSSITDQLSEPGDIEQRRPLRPHDSRGGHQSREQRETIGKIGDEENVEAMKAREACSAAARNPRPPKRSGSLHCPHTASATGKAAASKAARTAASKTTSEAAGPTERATWTAKQKLAQ